MGTARRAPTGVPHVNENCYKVKATLAQAFISFLVSQYGSVKNIVGWVEALRNPTNAAKCWVSFLNPTYTFLFFELNRTVLPEFDW